MDDESRTGDGRSIGYGFSDCSVVVVISEEGGWDDSDDEDEEERLTAPSSLSVLGLSSPRSSPASPSDSDSSRSAMTLRGTFLHSSATTAAVLLQPLAGTLILCALPESRWSPL
jgi:hypothetical protein